MTKYGQFHTCKQYLLFSNLILFSWYDYRGICFKSAFVHLSPQLYNLSICRTEEKWSHNQCVLWDEEWEMTHLFNQYKSFPTLQLVKELRELWNMAEYICWLRVWVGSFKHVQNFVLSPAKRNTLAIVYINDVLGLRHHRLLLWLKWKQSWY